jgi:uncharacterized protein YjgD (DUF1641 family)
MVQEDLQMAKLILTLSASRSTALIALLAKAEKKNKTIEKLEASLIQENTEGVAETAKKIAHSITAAQATALTKVLQALPKQTATVAALVEAVEALTAEAE